MGLIARLRRRRVAPDSVTPPVAMTADGGWRSLPPLQTSTRAAVPLLPTAGLGDEVLARRPLIVRRASLVRGVELDVPRGRISPLDDAPEPPPSQRADMAPAAAVVEHEGVQALAPWDAPRRVAAVVTPAPPDAPDPPRPLNRVIELPAPPPAGLQFAGAPPEPAPLRSPGVAAPVRTALHADEDAAPTSSEAAGAEPDQPEETPPPPRRPSLGQTRRRFGPTFAPAARAQPRTDEDQGDASAGRDAAADGEAASPAPGAPMGHVGTAVVGPPETAPRRGQAEPPPSAAVPLTMAGDMPAPAGLAAQPPIGPPGAVVEPEPRAASAPAASGQPRVEASRRLTEAAAIPGAAIDEALGARPEGPADTRPPEAHLEVERTTPVTTPQAPRTVITSWVPAESRRAGWHPPHPVAGPASEPAPDTEPRVAPAGPEPGPPLLPAPALEPPMPRRSTSRPFTVPEAPQRVPAPLRDAVLSAHGVDVAAVPIHRGVVAERLTAIHGARALTRDQEVFLPARLGPLDRPPADAVLAHELTHVVQQRRLGHLLPAEASPAGRQLEAQARAAAGHWDEHGTLPPPRSAPVAIPEPVTARREVEEMIAAALAATGLTVERSPAPLPAAAVPAPPANGHGLQREGGDLAGDEETAAPQVSLLDALASAAPQVSLLDALASAARQGDAGPASEQGAVSAPEPAAPAPSNAPEIDLERLARRVCDRVRSQLCSELLVDRERSGLLVDL